jgi:hypothetical protein
VRVTGHGTGSSSFTRCDSSGGGGGGGGGNDDGGGGGGAFGLGGALFGVTLLLVATARARRRR